MTEYLNQKFTAKLLDINPKEGELFHHFQNKIGQTGTLSFFESFLDGYRGEFIGIFTPTIQRIAQVDKLLTVTTKGQIYQFEVLND